MGQLARPRGPPPDDQPAVTVHRSTPLIGAAARMERHHIHRLVVVADDDETSPIGILSTTDLVRAHGARRRAIDAASDRPMLDRCSRSAGRAEGAATRAASAPRRRSSTCTPTSRSSAASVVPAYRRGVADLELPADAGLARTIIPPGTAATRDFSRLAPRIPEFLLEQCVGCMACVSACPDTAILGRRRAGDAVSSALADVRRRRSRQPAVATATARGALRPTPRSTATCRRGTASSRGAFGIFVDPVHCKGCAECVEVCAALGHDALVMIDKVAEEPRGESDRSSATRATCASSARCRRRRPSTATRRHWPT